MIHTLHTEASFLILADSDVLNHYHSHQLMLADALIAATAIQDGLPAGLELMLFKP